MNCVISWASLRSCMALSPVLPQCKGTARGTALSPSHHCASVGTDTRLKAYKQSQVNKWSCLVRLSISLRGIGAKSRSPRSTYGSAGNTHRTVRCTEASIHRSMENTHGCKEQAGSGCGCREQTQAYNGADCRECAWDVRRKHRAAKSTCNGIGSKNESVSSTQNAAERKHGV